MILDVRPLLRTPGKQALRKNSAGFLKKLFDIRPTIPYNTNRVIAR